MKTIKTHNGIELIVVDVPEDAYDFQLGKIRSGNFISCKTYSKIPSKIVNINLPKGNFKILGKLSELSEEECRRFVEHYDYRTCRTYRDYMFLHGTEYYEKEHLYDYFRAKESLISLLQSHGVDTSKNLLILEKI